MEDRYCKSEQQQKCVGLSPREILGQEVKVRSLVL